MRMSSGCPRANILMGRGSQKENRSRMHSAAALHRRVIGDWQARARWHAAADQHPSKNEAQLPDIVRDVVRQAVNHLGSMVKCGAMEGSGETSACEFVADAVQQACAAKVRNHSALVAPDDVDVPLRQVAMDHTNLRH
eukprot:CAMPEP_0176065246 /NCGR_PEP_ID=MMETSP0120_2-20121206/32550_1 /TAXON_ID=160619 /ORGANISM="Kryptoperidinium foliaceum, Strain CCMP 1326" /LENGTH=137 /DNA_ID=CAMNT_0017398833 /DNA_START=107 /DNA_END=520 /DNA_ORIENTATION=+